VEKANQELHATDDVCSMFRLMARMLSVASPLVQLAAVESLHFLASVDDSSARQLLTLCVGIATWY
jgi:hypothetical protein